MNTTAQINVLNIQSRVWVDWTHILQTKSADWNFRTFKCTCLLSSSSALYPLCHSCQFSRVTSVSTLAWRTHIITYFISFTRSKVYILWMCFHLIMLGNNLGQGSYLRSREWLQTISQAASSQRSLADNMKGITLYITTLGSHKHNKSRAKSIKHGEQMEEGGEEHRNECKEGSHWGPERQGGNMTCQ